uniref:Serpentine receptor class gamma n=1 Tax=Strongyloides papillosus TaxID=174720 RepID=A0A0N5BZ38_STREA
MISVLDIIQLTYKIPSMLLMVLSIYVIIKEIKSRNVNFNTQFYIIIVCKLSNEVIYNINIFLFFKLPKWGCFNNFMKENNWMATFFYILATQQIAFIFLITLLISINRYIAVKYPLLYNLYFLKSKIVVILLFFITLSTLIGLGNISFNARFDKFESSDHILPSFQSKNAIYYQIFYQIFLFGIISIATCAFNTMAILTLRKLNKNGTKYKKELYYIIYSIFIFLTLLLVQAFYVFNILAELYKIRFFINIIHFHHILAFDLTSIGDFYFLIYSW